MRKRGSFFLFFFGFPPLSREREEGNGFELEMERDGNTEGGEETY